MRFFIYETDLRQKSICNFLESKKFTKVSEENLNTADIVILPFIYSKEQLLLDQSFFNNLKNNVTVYTGGVNLELKKLFTDNNINLITIMEQKEISILNSIPTAEGVLYHILDTINTCILDSNILVLGYGICGSEIANKLNLLGATVTTIENCNIRKSMAKIKGIGIIEEKDIINNNYNIIINTIPHKVITSETLSKINNTIILDIASPPYGFNTEEIDNKKHIYKRLGGLPSKFGVEYSGKNIGNFICEKIGR